MANNARVASLADNINRTTRAISYPKKDGKPVYTSEFFGENVFSLHQIAKALPKPAYASFLKQMRGRQALDKATADAIAHAVRIWAMDRGATHFTHWFQPQTGTTAEKHDAFLSLKSNFTPNGEEVRMGIRRVVMLLIFPQHNTRRDSRRIFANDLKKSHVRHWIRGAWEENPMIH
jgi:glutamine synthetase